MLYVVSTELQDFLNNFYTLTGIKVAINDCDITFGVVSHSDDLCDRMQSNPAFHDACMACDAKALADCKKAKKEFYIAVMPVFLSIFRQSFSKMSWLALWPQA